MQGGWKKEKTKLFMNYIVFNICWLLFLGTSLGFSKDADSELHDRVAQALEKRRAIKNLFSEEYKTFLRRELKGLSDEEKSKGLALWLFSRKGMHPHTPNMLIRALYDDPHLIQDSRPLRKLIQTEKDPRRFYLLVRLSISFRHRGKEDFIPEMTGMLFRDGKVADIISHYEKPYYLDVSKYTYAVIVGSLRAKGANFEPPHRNLPHEEQVAILAKWLKENWPGCENLEIPAQPLGKGERLTKVLEGRRKTPSPKRAVKLPNDPKAVKDEPKESCLPLIISGLFLIGILFFILKAWRHNYK